jgi:parvulin-like peptidyl-prolyl isomerase
MKQLRQLAILISLTMPCFAQQVIDRMVAVVDNHVITQSDWEEQENFEALVEGRKAGPVRHLAESLERLIDRQLISEHIGRVTFEHATPEQVVIQISEIRKQVGEQGKTDESWRKTLAAHSLSEEDLAQIVAGQLDVLRFVDVRFRPSVQIAPELIESYYQKTFLPELKKSGMNDAALPPLKQVEERIRQLLVEQRVNEVMNTWVQGLRTQANIQRLTAAEKTN